MGYILNLRNLAIALFIITIGSSIFLLSREPDLPSAVAAEVKGEQISKRAVEEKANSLSPKLKGYTPSERRQLALQELILLEWVKQEANILSTKPTESAILRLPQEVKVSPALVSRSLELQKSQLNQPERRDIIRIINPKEDKIKKALREIDSGISDSEAVSKYSSNQAGGPELGLVFGQLTPELNSQVFRLPLNSWSNPIRTSQGYQLVKIIKIHPPISITEEQARERITRGLEARERTRQLEIARKKYQLRWRTQTKCAENLKISLCKNGPPLLELPKPGAPA